MVPSPARQKNTLEACVVWIAQKPGTSRDTLFHSFTIPTYIIGNCAFYASKATHHRPHRRKLHFFPVPKKQRYRRKNCTSIVMQSGTVHTARCGGSSAVASTNWRSQALSLGVARGGTKFAGSVMRIKLCLYLRRCGTYIFIKIHQL